MADTTTERTTDWFQVYSGKRWYPLEPRPEDFEIEDIARGLAFQVRFMGQTREPYSIAQHSVLVSWNCSPENALWGLMHDASEAVLSDVPRPLKREPAMLAFRVAEDEVMEAICERFGLHPEIPEEVHHWDNVLLATEARDLLGTLDPGWAQWLDGIETLPAKIVPWSPLRAMEVFLARFRELTEVRPDGA